MKRKVLIGALIILFILAGGYLLKNKQIPKGQRQQNRNLSGSVENYQNKQPEQIEQPKKEKQAEIKNDFVLQNVPFALQAPFGNWDDPIFQNGCEEASMIMAVSWLKGIKQITPRQTQVQIEQIVAFENKTLGYNTDTNVDDVQQIFKQYFNKNVSIKRDPTINDLESEIQKGNIILVPAFGRVLGNPYFTAPGPVTHMLVVIGYDPSTKEFITNDPGTKRGQGYRYAEKVLESAIWNYPSGPNLPDPPMAPFEKAIIVVTPML